MEALNKKLCNAVRNGNVDLVQDCLHKGADLHYEDDHGQTPLHLAAEGGYTEVTKVLLEAGASLSAVDKQGMTPLHLAAEKGHTEVTKVLVEAGASVSAVNDKGQTPLHQAAEEGHTGVTKVLLEAGASLSAVDIWDRTPLHRAAQEGYTEVTKVLLEAGASLSAVDELGMTPLHMAAWWGYTEVTKVLLEAGASLSAVDNEGRKPLHLAALWGRTEVTKVLVEAGASVSAVDKWGMTPLHLAARMGYTEVTKVLVEAGASLSAVDNDGWTPLHKAAEKGYIDVTKVLLEAGASLSAVDHRGMTPLHLAARMGYTEVTKVLVEAGASLSAVDNDGWTPLHKAAEKGYIDVTKVLLEAGASLSAVDHRGMTPLHQAALRGHTGVTKVLVEAGASLSAVDKHGWTPLHQAAVKGNTEVTKVLVEAGASLSAVDNDDRTPLHLSERQGNTDVTKILVEAGASLSAVDKQVEDTTNSNKFDTAPQEESEDVEFPMMGTSDETKELLVKGTFKSYENCVYLAGGCNVGKSTLASILIGEEIPTHWISTDGLNIYFGRNGIDLKKKEMVPLKQGSDGDVLSKVLRGKPDIEKPDTTLPKNREDVQLQDSSKESITPQSHTSTAPTLSLVPEKDDVNITDPRPIKQKSQNYIIDAIQEKIKNGTYEIDIAPSDLVDFGGQRSFDMTHQLFMRKKGTFVLMFNGTIDLSIKLTKDKGETTECKTKDEGETTESILKHWVNSILSYCVDEDDVDDKDKDILPIILFCATHSDAFNQEDRIDRKAKLIHDLGEIFKNHKWQYRIIYDDIFFINGQEKNDLEINKLKSKLVEVAFKQKSWGKRMPIAWVPLELQMSELRLHNMNIISKEELITLNQRNEDLALNVEQIKYFLNAQHSMGKILYFDQHGLDHFIIVQPQSLVNILRSFITAEHFWPKEKKFNDILSALTDTGQISKTNLLKLWSQEKFHQDMPNDDFKEFIIQVLVHLDILVEPRHYRQEKESKVQSYLVPCMVKHRPPKTDVKSADRMICLSYRLLKLSIPAALSFKLIGAAMNVWPLQKRGEDICLYHQAAILCIDELNELHLSVEDYKIFVYLINKEKKDSIPQNLASTAQECLTLTMTKVLEFYHNRFGKSQSTFEVSKAFKLEVGEWCTSGEGCYISVSEVKEKTEWKCKNERIHQTKCPHYWIYDQVNLYQKQVKCDENCSGLDEKQLAMEPKEKDFMRLAKLITIDECHSVVVKLGLTHVEWDDILLKTTYDSLVKRFVAFYYWKNEKANEMYTPTYQKLFDAFNLIKVEQKHPLCQVFKEDETVDANDVIANSQEIPRKDVLWDLSQSVGNCAIHLGVELGLDMVKIEETLVKYPKSMYEQTFDVLKKWQSSGDVKTICMLMKAFKLVDGRGVQFLRHKYRV